MRESLTLLARILLGRKDAAATDMPWHKLQPTHVDILIAKLGYLAPASQNKHMAALRGIVTTMRRGGLLSVERAAALLDFKSRKNDRPLAGRCLSPVEINVLLGACTPRDAALLILAYCAGMRRDEIARAVGSWLSPDDSLIRIIGKGGKIREVPLPPVAQAYLAAWWKLAPKNADAPIIRRQSKHGGPTTAPLSGAGVYAVLEDVATRAGVADFAPHDLRRTFVTELLDRGVDPITVARMAGHSDTKTTMRYDRRPARVAAAAAIRLGEGVVMPMPTLKEIFSTSNRRPPTRP